MIERVRKRIVKGIRILREQSHVYRKLLSIRPGSGLLCLIAVCSLLFHGCKKSQNVDSSRGDHGTTMTENDDASNPAEIQEIAKRLHLPAAEVAKTRSLPREELLKIADEILNLRNTGGRFIELKAAEDLVADYFIKSLREPNAFQWRDASKTSSRAVQALSFLQMGTYPEIIPILKESMSRGNVEELKIIVTPLVSFASMEVHAEINQLLNSNDKAVASHARHALMHAAHDQKIPNDVKIAIWPGAEASFVACLSDQIALPSAAELLFVLDKDRALKIIDNAGILKVNHPMLSVVLDVMIRKEVPPSEELLLSLLDKNDYQQKHVKTRLTAAALMGLVQCKSSQAEARIMKVLDSEERWNEKLGSAAWIARFKLAGRIPLIESAMDSYFTKDHKLENLNGLERDAWLLSMLDLDITVGGAWKWLERDEGLHSAETLAIAKKIGANEHAQLIQEFITILEPKGPIHDYEKRMEFREEISESDDSKIELLGEKWMKLPSWELYAYEWDWNRPAAER